MPVEQDGDDKRTTLAHVRAAIELGTHILLHAPNEMANQLVGRLGELPALHHRPEPSGPAFRLVSHSLTAPGGPLLRTLEPYSVWMLQSGRFSPDGQLLALVGNRVTSIGSAPKVGNFPQRHGAVWLWDVASGRALRMLTLDDSDGCEGCAFSLDGSLFAVTAGGVTVLWDAATWAEVRRLAGHTALIADCAFSPDGTLLATAGEDKTARLWDVASGRELHRLAGHTDKITRCVFSPDGSLLATTGDEKDKSVRIWDVATGMLARTIHHDTGADPFRKGQRLWHKVEDCVFSPDGALFATAGSYYGGVKVWDTATWRVLRDLHGSGSADCVAFSPDGETLATTLGPTIYLWQRSDVAQAPAPRSKGYSDWDLQNREWNDFKRGDKALKLNGSTSYIQRCAFHPDGRHLVTVHMNEARLWDAQAGQPVDVTGDEVTHQVKYCAFSSDGALLATTADDDGFVRIWDVGSNRQVNKFRDFQGWPTMCTFSPDGRTLAVATDYDGGTTWVLDVETGKKRHELPQRHRRKLRDRWPSYCAFSPDGRSLITAARGGLLRQWDVVTGRETRRLRRHRPEVEECAYSPDGRLLAITNNLGDGLRRSPRGTLRVWEAATGREVGWLSDPDGKALRCAFSPDGRIVASEWFAMNRHNVLEMVSGIVLWTLPATMTPRRGLGRLLMGADEKDVQIIYSGDGLIHGWAFSPNGRVLVVAKGETLRAYDVASAQELCAWQNEADLTAFAWHPRENLVVAGDVLGRLHWLRVLNVE